MAKKKSVMQLQVHQLVERFAGISDSAFLFSRRVQRSPFVWLTFLGGHWFLRPTSFDAASSCNNTLDFFLFLSAFHSLNTQLSKFG